MAWREWPLVAFTLLGQLATGIYLFFVLPAVLAQRPGDGVEGANVLPSVIAGVIAILGVGAAASFFHLGRPLRAPNALSNLRTSWLSREVLFGLLFVFFLAILFLLIRQGWGAGAATKAAALFAGLAGALFVISMARLYMIPGVPAWNRAATPFSFSLATMTLGTLGALVVGEITLRSSGSAAAGDFAPSLSWLRVLAMTGAALVALSVAGHVLLAPYHGVLGLRAIPSLKPAGISSVAGFALRLVLLTGVGIALLAALAVGVGAKVEAGGGVSFVRIAFGLSMASELLARFEFYALGAGRR